MTLAQLCNNFAPPATSCIAHVYTCTHFPFGQLGMSAIQITRLKVVEPVSEKKLPRCVMRPQHVGNSLTQPLLDGRIA